MGGRRGRRVHAGRARDASALRPGEHRHGVPAGGGRHRAALHARRRRCYRGAVRARRSTSCSFRRAARSPSTTPVPADLRDHAGGRADHLAPASGRASRRAAAQAALEVEAETERIRSALLASISHDLRTPLAVMAGASSSLAESGERMSAGERHALASSVFQQAREMSEHVAKILQMTRLGRGRDQARARLGSLARDRRIGARPPARAPGARTASSSSCPTTCRWCASTRR